MLIEKGLVSTDAIDTIVNAFQNEIGPRNGARMVARAWVDPAYRERLLTDAVAAAAEFGYGGMEGEQIRCVENTPEVHNVIVCTLCSCYPWPILGIPPVWYKSPPYRSRVVREPRAVLARVRARRAGGGRDPRLGLERRPALHRPSDAARRAPTDMTEDELADLVSRDCMIGVAVPRVGAGGMIDREADEPFTEPWQARAFAMAVVAAERMGVDWDEFRDRLKAAIAERPGQPYYESWLDALEDLTASAAATPR